jgi:hypothetical protein
MKLSTATNMAALEDCQASAYDRFTLYNRSL